MTAAVITSPAPYSRQRATFAPAISIEVGGYIVECVSQPRMLIFRDLATGVRTYRPLAPTLYTLALLFLQRCSEADTRASRIFITLEEAISTAYPREGLPHLDKTTRRRIGRLVNRLSEVLHPYFLLVNIHMDHRCIGYQLALPTDTPLGAKLVASGY
jgi:hypothetical protein